MLATVLVPTATVALSYLGVTIGGAAPLLAAVSIIVAVCAITYCISKLVEPDTKVEETKCETVNVVQNEVNSNLC